MTRLSIVGKDYHTDENVVGYYNTGDRMKYWGKQGAFWGGLWGLLFGSAFFFIPGIGPLVVAGPLVTWIVGALEGAAIMGGLSALGAGLYGMGIPKDSILQYETAIKTGKYAPTGPEVERHSQLGLYQLAVDHGAADELVGRPAVSGGAELVQLRLGDELPKVQHQPPATGDGPRLVEQQLAQAAAALRAEEFAARPGTHCERCTFWAVCPAKASGSVLS